MILVVTPVQLPLIFCMVVVGPKTKGCIGGAEGFFLQEKNKTPSAVRKTDETTFIYTLLIL